MALSLERKETGRRLEAMLPVPAQVARFVRLPDGPRGQTRYLPLEDLLEVFLDRLFPGYEPLGMCTFRVLRDSDLEIEEEAEDLVREFETALKRRRRGEVIRLKLSANAPEGLRRTLVEELGVAWEEVIEVSRYHRYRRAGRALPPAAPGASLAGIYTPHAGTSSGS
jgi:polyphosphate kinase